MAKESKIEEAMWLPHLEKMIKDHELRIIELEKRMGTYKKVRKNDKEKRVI